MFKVGDKVRIVDDSDMQNVNDSFVTGSVHEIVGVDEEDETVNLARGKGYWWWHRRFALVTDEPETQPDPVNHPSHYSEGMPAGVEVLDVIRAQNGSWEHSNAIKYLLRAKYKGHYVTDLKKAVRYLTWAIEQEETK